MSRVEGQWTLIFLFAAGVAVFGMFLFALFRSESTPLNASSNHAIVSSESGLEFPETSRILEAAEEDSAQPPSDIEDLNIAALADDPTSPSEDTVSRADNGIGHLNSINLAPELPAGGIDSFSGLDPNTRDASTTEQSLDGEEEEEEDPFPLAGIVVDEQGEPIRGAQVELNARTSRQQNGRSDAISVTEADGRFSFDVESTQPDYSLRAQAEGFNDATRSSVSPLDGELRIILKANAELTIRAVDELSGEVVETAKGKLIHDVYDNPNWVYSYGNREFALSGGEARLEGIRPSSYRIELFEEDVPNARVGSKELRVTGGAQTVVIEMGRDSQIFGTVFWKGTEQPAAGTTVRLISTSQWEDLGDLTAPVDADGIFEFDTVSPGTYQILPEEDGWPLAVPRMVQVTAFPLEPFRLQAERLGSLRVRTVDEEGNTFSVNNVSAEMSGAPQERDGLQEESGVFMFSRMLSGTWDITVNSVRGEKTESYFLAEGAEEELEIVISSGVEVSGIVEVRGDAREMPRLFLRSEDGGLANLGMYGDGNYRVYLASGRHRLWLDYNRWEFPLDQVIEVPEGQTQLQHNFIVTLADLQVVALDEQFEEVDAALLEDAELSLLYRSPDRMNGELWFYNFDEPRRLVTGLPAGDYQAAVVVNGIQKATSREWQVADPAEDPSIITTIWQPTQKRSFEITINLPDGTHMYKYWSPPANWTPDTLNPQTMSDGANINSVVEVPGHNEVAEWPRVNGDGSVTFRAEIETHSDQVYLRGSFNNWGQDERYRMAPID